MSMRISIDACNISQSPRACSFSSSCILGGGMSQRARMYTLRLRVGQGFETLASHLAGPEELRERVAKAEQRRTYVPHPGLKHDRVGGAPLVRQVGRGIRGRS